VRATLKAMCPVLHFTSFPPACLLQSLQQQLQQQQSQQQQQSDADNIKVVVRLRPLFPYEQSKGAAEVAHVSEDYSSLKVLTAAINQQTMLLCLLH
jgi:hypothetical protein